MQITNTEAFQLLQDVLQGALSLRLQYLKDAPSEITMFDDGLRSQLDLTAPYQDFQEIIQHPLPAGTVLHYQDDYHIHYLISSGRSSSASWFCIGPFRITELTEQDFSHMQTLMHLSDQQIATLKAYYSQIPLVPLSQVLSVAKNIFMSVYGNISFHIKTVQRSITPEKVSTLKLARSDTFSELPLEEIFTHQCSMVRHAVNGDYNSALLDETFLLGVLTPTTVFDPQNYRHQLTWCNALFRKEGHDYGFPIQALVELYLSLQRMIDECNTYYDYLRLRMKMLNEYCTFFQEYSVSHYSPLVRHAINYIRTNLQDNLDLGTLSGVLGFSSTYILHKFKKEVGVSPMQFVLSQRMKEAQRMLLSTDKPIQEIAHAVGIADMSYFAKQFKKAYGQTPSKFKKEQKEARNS